MMPGTLLYVYVGAAARELTNQFSEDLAQVSELFHEKKKRAVGKGNVVRWKVCLFHDIMMGK